MNEKVKNDIIDTFDSLEATNAFDWSATDWYRAGFCRALEAMGVEFSVFGNEGRPNKLEINKITK